MEVAPEAKPPVCRIMDYGKFRYERSKKSHRNKAHQTRLKEIRVRPRTGQHDIDFKVRQAIGFLEHKDKVQVTVMFRGRELAHIDEGKKVMEKVVAELAEVGKLESPPQYMAKQMIATLTPK